MSYRKPDFNVQLQAAFITGLVVLAPLVVTLWVIWNIAVWMETQLPFGFWGGGLLTLALILLVGFLSRTAMGSVLLLFDIRLARLPLIGAIYSSVRDLMKAVSGEERRFRDPVIVRFFPGSKIKRIGFVTRDDLRHLGLPGDVAIYFPDSYNISGMLWIVPRALVKPLKTKNKDIFTFVATGGLAGAQHGVAPRRD